MKIILTWLLLILLVPAFAHGQVTQRWVARYAAESRGPVVVAVDANTDQLYVAGVTGSEYALLSYDPDGNQLWAVRNAGSLGGLAVDSNGGRVYVSSSARIVAYDSNGNQLWVATYSGGIGKIVVDVNTGNVYAITSGQVGGVPAAGVVAFDSNGNQLWVALYAPFRSTNSFFADIAVDNISGNVYTTGTSRLRPPINGCMEVVAFNNTGSQLWAGGYCGGGFVVNDGGSAITVGADGNVYATGFVHDDFTGTTSYFTQAYAPGPLVLWSAGYSTRIGGRGFPAAIAADNSNGNVYVTGSWGTVAYDSTGRRLWTKSFNSGPIAVDSNTGNVYLIHNLPGSGTGSDYGTEAYDSMGSLLWTARYHGPVDGGLDLADAIAVDGNLGKVYVTGTSQATATSWDFTTVAYSTASDTTPPVTTATSVPGPNDNGWNNTSVTVTLNSTDPEPDGTGVKEIHWALTGAQTGSSIVAGGTGSLVISAEGTTTLTYFGIDNAGNQEVPKSLTVNIDRTPPLISGMPAAGCALWPPNHKFIQVANVRASDALSGLAPGSFRLTGTSNEPSDPSDPDILIAPDGAGGFNVQLRAERLGTGTGRIYTLNATAMDNAGNSVAVTSTCTVPHDQRQ